MARNVYLHKLGGIESFLKEVFRYSVFKNDMILAHNDAEGYSDCDSSIRVNQISISSERLLSFISKQGIRAMLTFTKKKKEIIQNYNVRLVMANTPSMAFPFIDNKVTRDYSLLFFSHGETINGEPVSEGSFFKSHYHTNINRKAHLQSDKTVFVSKYEMERFKSIHPGRSDYVQYIPTMIDCQKLSRFKKNQSTNPWFVYAGRLNRVKNVELIISAFTKLPPNYELYIVGDGPDRKMLEMVSRKLGGENRIVFTGFLKHEHLFELIASSVAVVLASKREGKPMIALESLGLGVPVIAPKIPAFEEFIVADQNGVLFEPDSVDSLKESMIELDNKSHLRGLSCLETALQFDSRCVVPKIDELLESKFV